MSAGGTPAPAGPGDATMAGAAIGTGPAGSIAGRAAARFGRLRAEALAALLVAPFEALGKEPIVYPDTEPMHLNVARLERLTAPDRAGELLTAPPDLARPIALHAVEVVVTDFLVSPDTLGVLETVTLA